MKALLPQKFTHILTGNISEIFYSSFILHISKCAIIVIGLPIITSSKWICFLLKQMLLMELFPLYQHFLALIGTIVRYVFNPAPVIFKHTHPFKFQHSEYSFFNDAFVHFRNTVPSVNKCYWNFFYCKTKFPGSKFHFYLKRITNEADLV